MYFMWHAYDVLFVMVNVHVFVLYSNHCDKKIHLRLKGMIHVYALLCTLVLYNAMNMKTLFWIISNYILLMTYHHLNLIKLFRNILFAHL